LLVVWGSFRYFVDLPPIIEELWFKPVIWLVPLFWWNVSLKNSVSLFDGSIVKSVIYGSLAAIFYFFITSLWREISSVNLDLLGIAMVTAVVEELTFSGFLLGYLLRKKTDWVLSLVLIGFLTALIRIPILLFGYQLEFRQGMPALIFVFSSAMINAYIRLKSKNVTGSVLARTVLNLGSIV
jgi:hypothetical protein